MKCDINGTKFQWVRRTVSDGDIYYDRDTRTVYRNRPQVISGNEQPLWSLPTFISEAPLKVYFDFTYLCNLECRHCITNSSPRAEKINELRSDRIKTIMDELASIGVLELGIGGGEPLCHSDLFSFLTHARTLQLNIVLTTNGILVTPLVAERIKESGISELRVSFDGSQPVHDLIRGIGNYRKALEAIKLLIRHGVKAVPRLTVCNDETLGLDNLFKDLKLIGATSIKVAIIEPRGRASLSTNKGLFKYERDDKISSVLLDLAQKYDLKLKLPSDLAGCAELADGGDLRLGKIKSCGSGLETAYISPYGNVQPCSGTPEYVFGNVKDNSFISVWKNAAADSWRKRACSSCSWCLCVQKTQSN
jgi:MoaA/NifB/PqqE/SkfB family radical SAM enzyme